MSKVDWSLAPEGATHWTPDRSVCNQFLKFDKEWFWFGEGWVEYGPGSDWMEKQLAGVISRPEAEQAKQWSGPKDGLPPIGLEVDFSYRGCPQGTGKVLFYGNEFCIVQNTTGGAPYEQVAEIEDYSFTAICDAEQLAAEQRETAIREIMDIADVDCRVTAARLVDAGFKREVV